MADLGGGGHTRARPVPPPPFWNLFVHLPPPLLKPKKKRENVSEHSNVLDPPCLGLARLSTLVALRKKKCRSPPPPRSSAFLGLARLSRRLAAVRKKPVCCAPPPLFLNPGSAPGMTHLQKHHGGLERNQGHCNKREMTVYDGKLKLLNSLL